MSGDWNTYEPSPPHPEYGTTTRPLSPDEQAAKGAIWRRIVIAAVIGVAVLGVVAGVIFATMLSSGPLTSGSDEYDVDTATLDAALIADAIEQGAEWAGEGATPLGMRIDTWSVSVEYLVVSEAGPDETVSFELRPGGDGWTLRGRPADTYRSAPIDVTKVDPEVIVTAVEEALVEADDPTGFYAVVRPTAAKQIEYRISIYGDEGAGRTLDAEGNVVSDD